MDKMDIFLLKDFLKDRLFLLWERLTGYSIEKKRYKKVTGNDLNLKNPKTFSEKIVWKKIYDRNPLMPIVADKYRVRQYVKEILGEEKAEKILVPLFYVTDKPETIPFDSLTPEYIIKPNHASGKHIIVEKDTVIDRKAIIEQCKKWLRRPYGLKGHEWAYQRIERKIVVEKLLRDSGGMLPNDYKFFVIHGKCHAIKVITDRFTDAGLDLYAPDWKHLDVKGIYKQKGRIARPENLEGMINMAEVLGAPFDAIRVDLYLVDGKIYFGELTNYDLGGRIAWTPASFNYELGAKWKIVPGYWKRDARIQELVENLCRREERERCSGRTRR